MSNKRNSALFACSAILSNKLICETVEAVSLEDSAKIFAEKYGIVPENTQGPFTGRVRNKIIKCEKVLKFCSSQPRKAIYEDWIVNAFLLSEPIDHAYLIFIGKVNGEKTPFPKGTMNIVPLSTLRFINE